MDPATAGDTSKREVKSDFDRMTPEEELLRAVFGERSESERRGKRKKTLSVSDFEEIFRAPPWQRIEMIREGISARDVKHLQERLGIPQSVLLESLRMSIATLNRKVSRQENLSPEDSERVLGVSKLVGQVNEIVKRSGDTQGFDAASWLASWLQQSVPALGGARPLDFIDTLEGQAMVSQLLARMQSGAYS
jgi:putative toxin-antitoxin system antitoxin component (TIGR02293 family)